MKKRTLFALVGFSASLLTANLASANDHAPMVGGQQDAEGCLSGAGQSYSWLKQRCLQTFNEADIRLADPNHQGYGVDVILSNDRTQAELFGIDFPKNFILSAVKGGYRSQDGRVRLIKQRGGKWRLVSQIKTAS